MRLALTGAVVASLFLPSIVQANLCWIEYQMADNSLQEFLHQDFGELTDSNLVSDPQTTTWVYFDDLNGGINDPLPNLYDASGVAVTQKYPGSRYITYSHSLNKMVVDTTLDGEQNSDLPATVQAYLTYALTDCVAKGSDTYILVFSSHGGGNVGFGGDEDLPETRHRKLLQTNQDLASAISASLAAVSGAPTKVDVLGFDACLMQAFGVLDAYLDVAKYTLASETVEPGHGWAYQPLEAPTSGGALALAEQIVDKYVTEKQGGSSQQTPKLLSIIETDKYVSFAAALDDLCGEIVSVLDVGQDQDLYSFLTRSRSFAITVESVIDEVDTKHPSAVDIGDWLSNLDDLCNPLAGGVLRTKLDAAKAAYEAMFVKRGVGQGTTPGTGLHILWPLKSEYQLDTKTWDLVLFKSKKYADKNVPNFQDMMKLIFDTATPTTNSTGGSSVCGAVVAPDQAPQEGTLLINPKSVVAASDVQLTADLAAYVDQVVVEYGIDLTTPLKPFLQEQGLTPSDDDYLFLFGGDVWGNTSGHSYEANWDRNFYFLEIDGGGSHEALYVFDQGRGQKIVPVMYFPADKQEEVDGLLLLDFLFFDMQKWKSKGGRYGFLTYSVDQQTGEPDNNLILFTFDNNGKSYYQVQRHEGGTIIPVIWVDAHIQNRDVNILPGGFNQTKVPWKEELNYQIIARKDKVIFDVVPDADAVVISMFAYNFDLPNSQGGLQKQYYDINRPDKGQGGPIVLEGEDVSSGAESVSCGISMLVTTAATAVYAFLF